MKRKTELQKLQSAYSKADFKLREEVRRLFPYGSAVICRLTGYTGIVERGSLYADNVKIAGMHMSVNFLELIEVKNDQS